MSRNIRILPDTGSMIKFSAEDDINVEALLALCIENGLNIDLEKVKLVEKVSKAAFDTGDATIPNGDVTFFTCVKNPKGNEISELSRTDVYDTIRKYVNRDGDKAKDYFNQYGNYTRVSTETLTKLITKDAKKTPVTKTKSRLPKTTTVAASKSKTSTRGKKISKEEAEVIAARNSYKSKFYNKLG